MSTFRIKIEDFKERGVVIHLQGDAGLSYESTIRQTLDELSQEIPRPVIINLNDLDHINSDNIGLLIAARNQLGEHGTPLRLSSSNSEISDLFRAIRVNEIIPIYRSPEEAMDV